MRKIAIFSVVLLMASATLSGCLSTRAGRGAAVGGTAGAVVGGLASRSVGGAVVGGAVGATAGYLFGRHTYRCTKTNIFGERYLGWCLR